MNEALNGPLGELFDQRQLLTDVSGSGNNWAHGHHVYGPKVDSFALRLLPLQPSLLQAALTCNACVRQYREALVETIRKPVEECESLQSFLILHSLGGGTGSGLGSYILETLSVSPGNRWGGRFRGQRACGGLVRKGRNPRGS